MIEIRSFKRPTIRKNLLNRVLGKVNKDKEVDIHDEAEINEVEEDELIVESSEVIESTSTIDPSLISSTSPPVVDSTEQLWDHTAAWEKFILPRMHRNYDYDFYDDCITIR